MKYMTIRSATTHIDRQNEKFTIECLQSMVDQVNRQYIPAWYAHDPRICPLGRSISAELVQLPDGEFAVEETVQIFEPGDVIDLKNDGRTMPIGNAPPDRLVIRYDCSYMNPEDQAILCEMRDSVGIEVEEQGKKALEPISVLVIAASFALGQIASGFLSKMGEDAWDFVKGRLAQLLRRKKSEQEDHLLMFSFYVREDDRVLSLETILTNPTDADIDQFTREGLQLLDQMAPEYFRVDPNLVRVVHEYTDGKVLVRFGVRKDAVPLSLNWQRRANERDS